MRAFFPALPGLTDGRAGLGELGRTLGRGLGRGLETAGRGDGLLGRGATDGLGDDDGRGDTLGRGDELLGRGDVTLGRGDDDGRGDTVGLGDVTLGRGDVALGREVLGATLRLLPVILDCLPVLPNPLALRLVDGCVGNCALG